MIATVNRLALTSLPTTARLRPDDGKSHPLDGMVTRIGRQSDNDIVLPDPTVSRHHAVIIRSGPGYAIHDAGSANGITLQNRRIQGSAELTDGDRIVIGDSGFTFEVDDSASRVQETSKVI
jgi:pSer/pThr/pTyr-binding forkhead associated (FHA) protein